jgi:hypothetical protein
MGVLVRAALLAAGALLSALLVLLFNAVAGEAIIHWLQREAAELLGVPETSIAAIIASYSVPALVAGFLVYCAYRLGKFAATLRLTRKVIIDRTHTFVFPKPAQYDAVNVKVVFAERGSNLEILIEYASASGGSGAIVWSNKRTVLAAGPMKFQEGTDFEFCFATVNESAGYRQWKLAIGDEALLSMCHHLGRIVFRIGKREVDHFWFALDRNDLWFKLDPNNPRHKDIFDQLKIRPPRFKEFIVYDEHSFTGKWPE